MRLLLWLAVAVRVCFGLPSGPAYPSLVAEAAPPPSLPPVGGALVAALLPPAQTLRLFPNDFEDSSKACTEEQVLRAVYPPFSLPSAGPRTSLLFLLSSVDCAGGRRGILAGFGGGGGGAGPQLDAALDCGTQRLVLSSAASGSASFPLPPGAAAAANATRPLALLLTHDAQGGSFGVCVDGVRLAPVGSGGAALLAQLRVGGGSPLLGSAAVVLGSRNDVSRSARADVAAVYAASGLLDCNHTRAGQPLQALRQELQAAAQAGAQPLASVEVQQEPAGDAVVGGPVRFSASASPAAAGAPLRMRLTLFGLTPPGCVAAECGDWLVEATAAAPAPVLAVDATYPKPGRYIVRVEVTDMRGGVLTHDHAVLVRKKGDGGAAAPCCRHSAVPVAAQLGRPVSDVRYRDETARRQAAALGWSDAYWNNADLEAERLFDFGMLAPPVGATPLVLNTCQDSRLAGAGSPVLPGTTDALAAASRGRGKRLAIVPAGFSWANSTAQVACQSHWSGWQAASPHTLPAPGAAGGVCSTACTRDGTLALMRQTGLWDAYAQALAAASYGQLALSTDVAVLPELDIPYDSPAPDNFQYYETPARQALAAAGVAPWMYFVLAPQAQHRVPAFRAWSGGRSSGGAVVTQCVPSYYYAVHETGHRLGFRHANMYRLESGGTAAPSDPLGPGQTTTDGYSDQTDIMACCKGDYGLFNRLSAGWLRGGERAVLTAADLAAPSSRRVALWPFDRPESRGRLMALSVRRGADEVLVISFRSAPHYEDVSASGGQWAPQGSRHNVRGLSVEVVRRDAATGKWADHRGLLDFNLLTGDWPDALPDKQGSFPRQSAFSLLREGSAWHDAASGLLLSFEAVGGCPGTPGLPLYNHSARGFYGFRGEWPGQESFQRADYSGFEGLECAQLVITTAAAPPAGELQFSVEAAPAESGAAAGAGRRRLRMQPGVPVDGQPAAGAGGLGGSCGAGLAPVLRLRLPAGQPLSSVVWRDGANRTLLVQGGDELAAAASSAGDAAAAGWATPPVALPALQALRGSSADAALPCAGSDCQPRYSVLLVAPGGRFARADITPTALVSGGAAGGAQQQQLSVQYKMYQSGQLSYSQALLPVPCTAAATASSSGHPQQRGGRKGGGLPLPMIAGAAGGGAVAVAGAVGLAIWCWRRRRQREGVALPGAAAVSPRDSFMSVKC